MSQFRDKLKRALLGETSFESAEQKPMVQPEGLSDSDVVEVREERAEVAEAIAEVAEVVQDVQEMAATQLATASVANAATVAASASPAQAEAVVATGNAIVADASKQLDVEVPQLTTDSDGSVNEASMEGLMGWLGSAVKAFGSAVGGMFERIATGWGRLGTSSKSFEKRIVRIQDKMKHRAGNGGKSIKIGREHLARLVVNVAMTPNLVVALKQLIQVADEASLILAEYQKRLDERIKQAIFDNLSGVDDRTVWHVESADLVAKLHALTKAHPELLLGNLKLGMSEVNRIRVHEILRFYFVKGTPDATEVAKNLDMPVSMTNEELGTFLKEMLTLVTGAVRSLEKYSDLSVASHDAAYAMINRLVKETDEKSNMGERWDAAYNNAALLRIEDELLGELSEVITVQLRLWGVAVDAVNSALVVAEESVFQD